MAKTDSPAGLCIELTDIQVEPFDIEALDDEASAVDIPEAIAKTLEAMNEHGAAVPVGPDDARGDLAVPFSRCQANACQTGVMLFSGSGSKKTIPVTPLPGAEGVTQATRLQLVAVRADVDSDGADDLWVGYRVGGPASAPSTYHLAAFSLPELRLQWHGVVSETAPSSSGRGCDGALYPVDVDCDGDGDLVLIQRCGKMACLNDDSQHGCGTIEDRVSVFTWDSGAYHEARPDQITK